MVSRAKIFAKKLGGDNIGVLASVIAWNTLTSLVPILVGLIAISGFLLAGHASTQHAVIVHLSHALKGVLSPRDLTEVVRGSVHHSGLLGAVGVIGVLWGGSNVGGAISTVFQAIFETGGRGFVREKLLDIAMIFVMTGLLVVIIVAATGGALVNRLIANFPLSEIGSFIVGIIVSISASFLLFLAIYVAFPNTDPRLRLAHVWRGALIAAAMFEILTFIWPLYAHFARFSRYGAVLFPILLLTAWIYFFATILVVGAEVVAFGTICQAEREQVPGGPNHKEGCRNTDFCGECNSRLSKHFC